LSRQKGPAEERAQSSELSQTQRHDAAVTENLLKL